MAEVILFIACSLDGYIAREDGNIDWLTQMPNPDNNDHGYGELISRVDTIIMGRQTYAALLAMDIEWPYSDFATYILSHQVNFEISTPNTFLLRGHLEEEIKYIKSKAKKDIWLVGGGQIIHHFLNHHLIDQMIITHIPVILGSGIRLFPAGTTSSHWQLEGHRAFQSGAMSLLYSRKED